MKKPIGISREDFCVILLKKENSGEMMKEIGMPISKGTFDDCIKFINRNVECDNKIELSDREVFFLNDNGDVWGYIVRKAYKVVYKPLNNK